MITVHIHFANLYDVYVECGSIFVNKQRYVIRQTGQILMYLTLLSLCSFNMTLTIRKSLFTNESAIRFRVNGDSVLQVYTLFLLADHIRICYSLIKVFLSAIPRRAFKWP